MPNLVYIVDWLPPDYGAIGQYALKEAQERAREGEAVHLFGLSSTSSSDAEHAVGAGRLRVTRLKSAPVPRTDLKRRAAWTLATNARLVGAALRAIRSADEVLFTASPPFLEHLLVPLRPLIRGRLVFRIADVHPEVMMREMARPSRLLEAFRRLAVHWRRRADVIEVLGEDQRQLMEEAGVDPRRLVLRRSGLPVAWDESAVPMSRPPILDRAVLLLYSGAVGHAHDVDTFVEGYTAHHQRGTGRVVLWLNADGTFADRFEEAVRGRGLPIHRGRPVPLEQFCNLMVTADAHLITLKDEYVGLVVPSKVYGCIASGKQIFFVGSERSDVELLCQEQCPTRYERASIGDAAAVAGALERIADAASGPPSG